MIGGLGMQELLIVLIIALVLFGGKKLPEIGQNLGKAIRGFKNGAEEEPKDPSELKRETQAQLDKRENKTSDPAPEKSEADPTGGENP